MKNGSRNRTYASAVSFPGGQKSAETVLLSRISLGSLRRLFFLLSMFLACSYKSLNTKLNGTLRQPRPAVSTYYIKNRGLLLGVI